MYVAFIYIHDDDADIDFQIWGTTPSSLMTKIRNQLHQMGYNKCIEFYKNKKAWVPMWKIKVGNKEVGYLV